jgi:flagellar biosynthetic protein FliQ
MTQGIIIDVVSSALYTIILASAPPLLMGLIVGLAVSIFQSVTSIQEQTLAFIPKIIAVLFALIIFGPFILSTMTQFFEESVTSLPYYVTPR